MDMGLPLTLPSPQRGEGDRMGPMLISHSTPHGWFYWLDGSPPRTAISDTSLTECPGHEQVLASTTVEAATGPARLTVTTRIGDGGSLPPLEALLQRVADASLTQLELRIEGADALANWPAVQPWLVGLEKSLGEARGKLRLTVALNTRLAEVPPPFVGFRDASRARIIIEVTDDGLTDDESRALADGASAVADFGFLVRPPVWRTSTRCGCTMSCTPIETSCSCASSTAKRSRSRPFRRRKGHRQTGNDALVRRRIASRRNRGAGSCENPHADGDRDGRANRAYLGDVASGWSVRKLTAN